MAQRRKIMNIISEKIVYKNKSFDIKLRPVFQDLVENHCKMTQKIGKNRNAKNGIIKGVEPNSTPKYKKYSPCGTKLETFASNLYEKIIDINCLKIFSLL